MIKAKIQARDSTFPEFDHQSWFMTRQPRLDRMINIIPRMLQGQEIALENRGSL